MSRPQITPYRLLKSDKCRAQKRKGRWLLIRAHFTALFHSALITVQAPFVASFRKLSKSFGMSEILFFYVCKCGVGFSSFSYSVPYRNLRGQIRFGWVPPRHHTAQIASSALVHLAPKPVKKHLTLALHSITVNSLHFFFFNSSLGLFRDLGKSIFKVSRYLSNRMDLRGGELDFGWVRPRHHSAQIASSAPVHSPLSLLRSTRLWHFIL
ncbi:hypothetical protein CEXT_428861 [Caerostris extrusa]|uniref:Uncharacterized protein n=1 Tax=Caerostris extrusa TaxID=172846 RepID=A0AAV4MJU8_CAEEX|nr:hypothetical protein CEXT_428861 [Caerostris extrusa]